MNEFNENRHNQMDAGAYSLDNESVQIHDPDSLKRTLRILKNTLLTVYVIGSVILLTIGIVLDDYMCLLIGVFWVITNVGVLMFFNLKGHHVPKTIHKYDYERCAKPTVEFDVEPSKSPHSSDPCPLTRNKSVDSIPGILKTHRNDEWKQEQSIAGLKEKEIIERNVKNPNSFILRNGLFKLMKSSINITDEPHCSMRLHNWHKFNHREHNMWSKHFEY